MEIKPKATRTKAAKQTFVGFVLDKSGSMTSMQQEIVNVFNDQKKVVMKNARKGGKTLTTMVQFGATRTPVEVIFEHKAPSNIPILDSSTYRPEGMTPMYDGIGQTISLLEAKDDGGADTAFLVVVFSDGGENSSKEWNSKMIAEKISALQDTGRWSFVYLGANQDLTKVRDTLGLSAGNMFDWNNDTALASNVMASGTSKYFASRDVGITSTDCYVSK